MKYSLLLVLICATLSSSAQLLERALAFSHKKPAYRTDKSWLGLANYAVNQDTTQADSISWVLAQQNPFLQKYIQDIPFPGSIAVKESKAGGLTGYETAQNMQLQDHRGTPSWNSISNNILIGLSDFLVQRTKKELSIAFFQEFQERLERSEELKYLFPSTHNTLKHIGEDIYQFAAFWSAIRDRFREDIAQLDYNLLNYIQNNSRIQNENQRALLTDVFQIAQLIKEQQTPIRLIDYLANDAEIHYLIEDSLDQDLQSIKDKLLLVGFFSDIAKDKEAQWHNATDFKRLLKDTFACDLYLAFVYEKSKKLSKNSLEIPRRLAELPSKLQRKRQFVHHLRNFLQQGEKIQSNAQAISRLRYTKSAPTQEEELMRQRKKAYMQSQLVSNSLELIRYTVYFKQFVFKESTYTKQDSSIFRFIKAIEGVNKLNLQIRLKEYNAALMTSIDLLEYFIPEKTLDGLSCERQQLLKYGNFMTAVINANSPQEVSQALEAFALPPGSSAMKKYANFSIHLNAFVGVSSGMEVLKISKAKSYYALSSPVGISFNWGFKRAGGVSLFLSAIDIGALTSVRFEDEQSPILPELKIENVLAPGVYGIYNIPKYPLSIGIGAQLGPQLREIDQAGLGVIQDSGWRWGAFLAVDLPIISVYNSQKKGKKCRKNK